MEKFTQKYAIIQLLEPLSEGDEYVPADWPLHITLADVFAVEYPIDEVIAQLTTAFADRQPVIVAAGHDEYFGPQQRTQVTVLDRSEELIALHHEIVAVLKHAGATFNTPQYIEAGFRAHATVRPRKRLQAGDVVEVSALTVIDFFPNSDPNRRKVLKTIPLRGK